MGSRFKLLIFSLLLFSAGPIFAQTKILDNSGFAPGNLWFSKEPSVPGETVKIYTLVWNGSKDDISGTASFFDNDKLISKQNFILAADGSSKILSAPWTVLPGYHKIYAQITDSSGGPRGSKAITVSLQYTKTEEEEEFIGGSKETGGSTTTAKSYTEEKLDFAREYAEANLPEPVVGTVKYVAQNIADTRGEVKGWSEKKAEELRRELSVSPEEGGKWMGVERPFKYVMMFLVSLVALISGNAWLFYGTLAAIIFFVFRFVKNKFFF